MHRGPVWVEGLGLELMDSGAPRRGSLGRAEETYLLLQ
jgi:hypothetical protein